jgi:hypothetical protein
MLLAFCKPHTHVLRNELPPHAPPLLVCSSDEFGPAKFSVTTSVIGRVPLMIDTGSPSINGVCRPTPDKELSNTSPASPAPRPALFRTDFRRRSLLTGSNRHVRATPKPSPVMNISVFFTLTSSSRCTAHRKYPARGVSVTRKAPGEKEAGRAAEMSMLRMASFLPGSGDLIKPNVQFRSTDTYYRQLIEFSSCARCTPPFAICVRARTNSSSA